MPTEPSAPSFAFSDLRIDPLPPCALRLFTVDLEDWFHANFRSLPAIDEARLPSRVESGVNRLLDALGQAGARATFFVLGEVAARHAGLVRRVADAGHEVACHGYRHTLLYEQTPEVVARDVDRARKLLQDQSGQPVLGFRAPSWSITERNLWALDTLQAAGFTYDSSIFPARTYLYGIANAPRRPYRLTTPAGGQLVEIPPATLSFGRFRLGVGGGVYLRLLPLWLQKRAVERTLARGGSFVAYTHPREFDPDAWQLELPLSTYERLIHRFNLARGEARLRSLLAQGHWQRMLDALPAVSA
jgi:polysaccharide deacetylase family protein (PEP-CTERM system associated)